MVQFSSQLTITFPISYTTLYSACTGLTNNSNAFVKCLDKTLYGFYAYYSRLDTTQPIPTWDVITIGY